MTTLGRKYGLELSPGLLGGSLGGQGQDQGEAVRLIQQAARALEDVAASLSSQGGLQRSDCLLRQKVLRKLKQVYSLVPTRVLTDAQVREIRDCLDEVAPNAGSGLNASLGLPL